MAKMRYNAHGGTIMTANELNALMDEHGLNVKKVASMLCVTLSCVYRWRKEGEMGRKIPPMAAKMLRDRLAEPSGKVLRLGDQWGLR
jgi:transposase